MTTSTALTVANAGLASLWDYVSTTLTTGGVLAGIISIAVLFGAIAWIKWAYHRRF